MCYDFFAGTKGLRWTALRGRLTLRLVHFVPRLAQLTRGAVGWPFLLEFSTKRNDSDEQKPRP